MSEQFTHEDAVIAGSTKPRWVVCAANRSKTTGAIACGARHWDSAMRSMVNCEAGMPMEWHGAQQGFIDQYGVWMDRGEAWEVAKAAGQIKYPKDLDSGTLYSEDLY